MRALVIGLVLALTASQGLANNPDMRDRLHVVNPIETDTADDLEAEIRVGREVAARILARTPLSSHQQRQHYINLVGTSLAAHGERPELDYYFGLVESESVNAYAAPGGYIMITTATLELMKDEAELAGVLAHEIAHVNERHIVEALDIHAADNATFAGLARFFGGAGEAARVVFSQAVDQTMTLLFETGLRHEDEFEADREGTRLAAHSGYDPDGLRRFLRRLNQLDASEHTETVSRTHPPATDRLDQLTRFLTTQQLTDTHQLTNADRFQRYVD